MPSSRVRCRNWSPSTSGHTHAELITEASTGGISSDAISSASCGRLITETVDVDMIDAADNGHGGWM